MLKQKAGSIVNLSSVSGVAGDYGMAAYNAAKGGVTNLTRNMALDYIRDGIRVNAVCPGSIRTPLLESAYHEIGYKEASRKFDAAYPPGHIGEPRDVAHLILFLISDESRFINGANILIDGGITAHTGQPKFEIFPKSPDEFFWNVVNAEVTFVKDEHGKVTKAIHHQNGTTLEAPRID